MNLSKSCFLVSAVFLWGGSITEAQVTVIKEFVFDDDGVLPTAADPEVVYFAARGTPELTVYSVAGGVLLQRLFGITDNSAYIFLGGINSDSAGLSSDFGYSWEARLEVLQIDGQFGTFFDFGDGTHRYIVTFSSDGVYINNSDNQLILVDADIFRMRTYRIESQPNSDVGRLFIDGVLKAEWTARTSALNHFQIASGSISDGTSADVDWDFVRFSQFSEPVPTTSEWGVAVMTLLLLTAGTIVCTKRHRLAV